VGRLLELILLGFLFWLAWEGLKARIRAFFAGEAPRPQARPRPPAPPEEALVRCAACGTHVPASRALPGRSGGRDLYCSEQCRAAPDVR